MRIHKKGTKKRIVLFMTMFSIIMTIVQSSAVSASSSGIKDKINSATQEKADTQKDLKDTQNEISNLESSKSKLEDYLTDLNVQMTAICDELEKIELNMAEKEAQITITRENLEQARIDETNQYEDMKKRIQFMYENGDVDYIKMILESESFSAALSKFEYVSNIYEYDREMLEKYNNLKNEIAAQEEQLEQEQTELSALQDEQMAQQEKVAGLVADTSTKITEFSSQIANAEAKAAAYEEKIKQQESTIESLKKEKARLEEEEKKKQEEAKKKAEEAKKASQNTASSSTGTTSSSGKDTGDNSGNPTNTAMLAAIIQCEAGGESYEGKLAVGTVVMNRMSSSMYPNTLVGVIYQSGQFSPVASGRFSIVLGQGASSDCVSAAQQVLNGHRSGSWLHFKGVSSGISGTVIGNHVFY